MEDDGCLVEDSGDGFTFIPFQGAPEWQTKPHRKSGNAHTKLILDIERRLRRLFSQFSDHVQEMAQYFILVCFGKRVVQKHAIAEELLTPLENIVYQRIKHALSEPARRERVYGCIQKYTKRLINYFVVHYVNETQTCYYLDKRQYPFEIIGRFNESQQPNVLSLITTGAPIYWICLHHEYKSCRSQQGRRNLHAPYARSRSVISEGGEISLCELNFYIWFVDIAGDQAFAHFENDVRAKKILYDHKMKRKKKIANAKTTES
jgi:hypothetical protein